MSVYLDVVEFEPEEIRLTSRLLIKLKVECLLVMALCSLYKVKQRQTPLKEREA